ncbi:hypothetical protein [Nonomuraea typhae]|uniref:hypothetical protein n=1 Tax=Nonomuraea typhae TaxID=2603600 RepID=UPI0015E1F177|nr:hypothetical protein [Nonomuraea typhae]
MKRRMPGLVKAVVALHWFQVLSFTLFALGTLMVGELAKEDVLVNRAVMVGQALQAVWVLVVVILLHRGKGRRASHVLQGVMGALTLGTALLMVTEGISTADDVVALVVQLFFVAVAVLNAVLLYKQLDREPAHPWFTRDQLRIVHASTAPSA